MFKCILAWQQTLASLAFGFCFYFVGINGEGDRARTETSMICQACATTNQPQLLLTDHPEC